MTATYALFLKKGSGEWEFKGLTEHEEIACEFEEPEDDDETRLSTPLESVAS